MANPFLANPFLCLCCVVVGVGVCFAVCLLFLVVVCRLLLWFVLVVWLLVWTTLRRTSLPWTPFRRTPSGGPPSAGHAPNVRVFFSVSRHRFALFLYLWVSSRGILVVFEGRNPKMCTFGVLGLSMKPLRPHGRRTKKREFFCPPPFGALPSEHHPSGPDFSVFGPPLSSFGAPPVRGPDFRGPLFLGLGPTLWPTPDPKLDSPKMDWPKRDWPKSVSFVYNTCRGKPWCPHVRNTRA